MTWIDFIEKDNSLFTVTWNWRQCTTDIIWLWYSSFYCVSFLICCLTAFFHHWQAHNVIINVWQDSKDPYRDRLVSVYLSNCEEKVENDCFYCDFVQKQKPTVSAAIFYSFFTVTEVNRHKSFSVGILSMLSDTLGGCLWWKKLFTLTQMVAPWDYVV